MTRNNLDTQLRWMMRDKPSRPGECGMSYLPQAQWSFDALQRPSEIVAETTIDDHDFDDDLDDINFAFDAHQRQHDVLGTPAARPRQIAAPDATMYAPGASTQAARKTLDGTNGRRLTASSVPDSDIEVMDMTLESADPTALTRLIPSSNNPRKRKSDEYSQASRSAPQRARITGPTSLAEVDDIPAGPPPPYSTHPPRQESSDRRLHGARTGNTQPPDVVAVEAARDEYDDNDDLFDFNDSRSRNITVQRKSPARRSHAVLQSPHAPHEQNQDINTIRGSPSKVSTPQATEVRTFSPFDVPSSSARPTTKHDTKDLDAFFTISALVFADYLNTVEQREHDISARAAMLVEQDDCDSLDGLFKELDDLKVATNSIKSLRQRAQKMARLVQSRDECYNALCRHIKEFGGKDLANVKAANAAAKEELEIFQAECLALLNTCQSAISELSTMNQDHAASKQGVVQATQFVSDARQAMPPPLVPSRNVLQIPSHVSSPAETITTRIDRLPSHEVSEQYQRTATPSRRQGKAAANLGSGYGQENYTDVGHGNLHARQDSADNEYGLYDDADDMLEFAQFDEPQHASMKPETPLSKRSALSAVSYNARSTTAQQKTPKSRHSLVSHEDPQYASLFNQPWSNDVKRALRERFKLQGFRQGQLEAINATLAGEDTFVLMPTGGGKSLCYQLPSQIKSGKTRGVTIVVSPLLSLMEDQVEHLRRLNIQALLINGASSKEDRSTILDTLRSPDVETFIHILYVTPEMLSKSTAMINAFDHLYRNNRLARLVIDEAHCVSQWGHDFRPDYKLLGEVRRKYPTVPVMALTATATENVKADTIHNLGIKGCKVFTRSFNRPNLYYEIRMKGKAKEDLESIADLIKTDHKNQTGIIYCLSRKNCESMAEALQTQHKIKAHHYHAGMSVKDKTEVQQAWQAGRYHVIVATIAFGMGIDKANVRFVVHNSLPKSLEGYYQETGRAGRDGNPSKCYLFFGFADVGKLRRMIDENKDTSWEQRQRQHDMLRRMVHYCMNKADCRRVQVLSYFNEAFSREDCQRNCDNCSSDSAFEVKDVTQYANDAINVVRTVQHSKVTMLYCIDVFTGTAKKNVRNNGHEKIALFGVGQDLERADAERLFCSLSAEGAITEEQVMNGAGFPVQYAMVTPGFQRLDHLELSMRLSPTGKGPDRITSARAGASKQKGNKKSKATELPLSTNVSSPIQVAPKSKSRAIRPQQQQLDLANFAFDGDDDTGSDAFEAVSAPVARVKAARQAITSDDMLEHLDAWHQVAVEDFLVLAKDLVRKITSQAGLRVVLFSDTVLRQMAINFTTDTTSMNRIPGINKTHVERYGNRFCKLVKQVKKEYEQNVEQMDENMPNNVHHAATNASIRNPNAVVIEVSSDEDESDQAFDEDGDSDSQGYGTVDDEDFDLTQEPNTSSSLDANASAINAFNARFGQSQSGAMRMQPETQPIVKPTRKKKYGYRAVSGESSSSHPARTFSKKGKFPRRKAAGEKRSGATSRKPNAGRGASASKSTAAKANFITMMPT